ncbi:sulfatase family protein [Haloferula sp.]|uniref:sulfatase family protein n=1 Tax=Haloferula sp. TaxID=2497595 RepID=UPI003C737B48
MKLLLLFLVLIGAALGGEAKPNILWITTEDNSPQWLGCYGNEEAQTPRLDELAKQGNRFLHAYSNAPVCAVARSMILNGAYAVTMGTQHMRSRHRIPKSYRPYVSYLRENGYYCTNNSKTDYNFEGDDRKIWDECSPKANYETRPEGAPFFAIINLTTTHESSLFPDKNPAGPKRVKPADVKVPPYLPDLPEVRSDIGRYHDRMTLMDREVGEILDKLEKQGLAEDTIVFYYSDHGGPTPRGKRYLKETGVRVPMMIRVPEKFRKLSPFKPGEVIEELVGFVDLAPTLLSLIGLETPAQMQGRAFLGDHRKEPAEDDIVFLEADRFDEIYGMRRGLSDGRWKYIRRFTPTKPAAPYSFYQFSMPSWVAWRKAWQDGKLDEQYARMWETPQPVEELFDLKSDPWEIENLASDPAHAEKLVAMRERLKAEMIELKDTGVIPEPMWDELAGNGTIAGYVSSPKFDLKEAVAAAFLFGDPSQFDGASLRSHSTHADPVIRYWALLGNLNSILMSGGSVEVKPKLLDDEVSVNRVVAAEVFCAAGKKDEGHKALLAELQGREIKGTSMLYLLNAINAEGLVDEVPREWAEGVLADKKADNYVKRFAQMVLEP